LSLNFASNYSFHKKYLVTANFSSFKVLLELNANFVIFFAIFISTFDKDLELKLLTIYAVFMLKAELILLSVLGRAEVY